MQGADGLGADRQGRTGSLPVCNCPLVLLLPVRPLLVPSWLSARQGVDGQGVDRQGANGQWVDGQGVDRQPARLPIPLAHLLSAHPAMTV